VLRMNDYAVLEHLSSIEQSAERVNTSWEAYGQGSCDPRTVQFLSDAQPLLDEVAVVGQVVVAEAERGEQLLPVSAPALPRSQLQSKCDKLEQQLKQRDEQLVAVMQMLREEIEDSVKDLATAQEQFAEMMAQYKEVVADEEALKAAEVRELNLKLELESARVKELKANCKMMAVKLTQFRNKWEREHELCMQLQLAAIQSPALQMSPVSSRSHSRSPSSDSRDGSMDDSSGVAAPSSSTLFASLFSAIVPAFLRGGAQKQ